MAAPLLTGDFSYSSTLWLAAGGLQSARTSLQNLALREIATCGTAPEAGLANFLIFKLCPFAQKADAESVGGRG
jgi:hypothetical protein